MAQLLVRGLRDDVVARMKEEAGRNGRSVEAEHRAVLEERFGGPASTRSMIEALQGMKWLAELDAGELREAGNVGRDFEFDPKTGTAVRHARHPARHDHPD